MKRRFTDEWKITYTHVGINILNALLIFIHESDVIFKATHNWNSANKYFIINWLAGKWMNWLSHYDTDILSEQLSQHTCRFPSPLNTNLNTLIYTRINSAQGCSELSIVSIDKFIWTAKMIVQTVEMWAITQYNAITNYLIVLNFTDYYQQCVYNKQEGNYIILKFMIILYIFNIKH